MRPGRVLAVVAMVMNVSSSAFAQAPDAEPTPAAAAQRDPKEEARVRYQRGLELHEEGDQAAALAEFRRAYELAPAYRVLFNIGQLCYGLQDYACAYQSFQKYLKDGGAGISSARRTDVERDIAKLGLRVATLEIVSSVPGVEVSIDNLFVGRTPLPAPIMVTAGRRQVRGAAAGRVADVRTIDIAGTDAMRLELDLPLIRDDAARAAAPPRRTRRVPPKMTTYSWIGVGASGGAAITSGVTGLLALNASSKLQHTDFVGNISKSDASTLSTRVKTFSAISDVSLGVSVVTLAATLALTFLRGPTIEELPPEPRLRIGADGLGFRF